ncbi:MAG: helix-turn-helix domain-containing protein [Phycisphaeraceae bacterium]|nr:helix-turn-helix domain-containing protein [Phycisphaeraceae bacterium]
MRNGHHITGPGCVLTADEAAQRLGIDTPQVYRMIQEGQLPGLKFKGHWQLSPRSIAQQQPMLRLVGDEVFPGNN